MSCQNTSAGASICGDCKKSVGHCSWSKKLILVPGSTAIAHKRRDMGGRLGYRITECPLYEKDTREDLPLPKPYIRSVNPALPKEKYKKGRWTKGEHDYLRESLGKVRMSDIAKHLGRSKEAVISMTKKVRAAQCVKS